MMKDKTKEISSEKTTNKYELTAVPGDRDRDALGGGPHAAGRSAVTGGVRGFSGIGAGAISGAFAGIVSHEDMLRKKGALLAGEEGRPAVTASDC